MSRKKTTLKPRQEIKSDLEFDTTRTDRFAIFIAQFFGSVRFLSAFTIFILCWIIANIALPDPYDLFPFPVLEMIVSIFAIILSLSVLINQNRQGRIEKVKRQVEFEINIRAEEEITKVLTMLHEIHRKMGLHTEEDEDLEKMKERTDIKTIHKSLGDHPD